MKDTIEALKTAGCMDISLKIMIEGAPISDKFTKDIEAEYAADASSAVELANTLI